MDTGPAVTSLTGQTQSEAVAILEKVAATYGPVRAYQVEVDATMDRASPVTTMTTRLSFLSPGAYRLETVTALRKAEPGGATSVSALIIYDGTRVWGYRPDLNVYAVGPSNPLDADMLGIGPFRDPLAAFRKQNGTSIRLVGQETVSTPDGETRCVVVELTYPHGTSRMWIEQASYHVVKLENLGSTYIFRKTNLNATLPDETFRFAIPPGARKVDQIP